MVIVPPRFLDENQSTPRDDLEFPETSLCEISREIYWTWRDGYLGHVGEGGFDEEYPTDLERPAG